jgi:hypothetical protein
MEFRQETSIAKVLYSMECRMPYVFVPEILRSLALRSWLSVVSVTEASFLDDLG